MESQDITSLLQQQVAQLRRVVELKDVEIADLKRELALLKVCKSPALDPMASPSAQQHHLESSLPSKKDPLKWKIPDRSDRRSKTHSHNASIVSTTSSNYSLTTHNNNIDNKRLELPRDDTADLSLDLSDPDFIALGSSPRKPTPVRMKFSPEDLELNTKDNVNTIESLIEDGIDSTIVPDVGELTQSPLQRRDSATTTSEVDTLPPSPQETPIVGFNHSHQKSNGMEGEDDFNFGQSSSHSIIVPVYKKLSNTPNDNDDTKSPITQRMLMSRTPSEHIDMVSTFPSEHTQINPRLSVDHKSSVSDVPVTPPVLPSPANIINREQQQPQNHVTPPIIIQDDNHSNDEHVDHVIQLAEPVVLRSSKNQPPVRLERLPPQTKPTLPVQVIPITPITPRQPEFSPQSFQNSAAPLQPLQTDSHKFLINSLEHTVIKVETIVDPISINDPKMEGYWLLFKVFSNENPQQLTPMYRIKRSYNDFLAMDKTMRPMMPFLQQPPQLSSMKRQNYRLWEQNKLIIDSYIAQALSYLKRGMPNTDVALKSFTTYFEFNLPSMDDFNGDESDNSLNFLDLTNHWDYMLYVKQKFPNKTFDVIQLIFNNDNDILTIKSFTSKSEQIIRDDTIVSFKGQEIVLKKKKKFAANKVWILYAQSHQDGESIGARLQEWLKYGSTPGGMIDEEFDDFDDHIFDSNSQSSLTLPTQSTQSSVSNPPTSSGTSPALAWSLFGKRASKVPPTSPKSSHSNTSPHKLDNVLAFKSQPYEGTMTTSTSSITSMSSPNKKFGMTPTFEPIDNSPKYFGITLQGAFDLCPKYQLGEHNVPSVIFRCLNYLHNNSAEGFEGIFRLNGMMSEVNAIEREFNANHDCALEEMTPKPDVYSVATLMKRYLRKVDGGIIIDDIAEEIYHIVKNDENLSVADLSKIHGLVNELPVMNKDVLFVVFKYLMDVLKQGAHNKMGINAMSVLIGPNITESRGMPIAVVLMKNFNQIFDFK